MDKLKQIKDVNRDKNDRNCIELLKMARIQRARGHQEEAERLYAALVQVLRPSTAKAELKV